MKHATADALDRLEPLLRRLRELAGLTERKRGIFYRKSAAFLHFHEDPSGLYADVRQPDGEFARFKVVMPQEQDILVARAHQLLNDSVARPSPRKA